MIKSHNTYLTPDIEAVIDWHFQILGKDITDAERKLFFQVIVTDNALFPTNEHIEVVLKAFFSAIHYGNAELKGTNIRSHSILINEWLKHRSTIRPSSKPQYQDKGGKPEGWQYDPDEALPIDITRAKAKDLLHTIHKIYGTDTQRVMNSDNFMHYIEKLKDRYKGLR
jgi:hypothetical protein